MRGGTGEHQDGGRATVALVRCASYGDALGGAVARAVELAGGLGASIGPGRTVLIKPNLLTDAEPERAKTTHPEVVRAVIRLVRAAGADCVVGDSPASVLKLERVWERTGFRRLCDEEGVPLVALEQGGAETVEEEGVRFAIARRVLEADAVINVPKVKTHVLTTFTGAVKNLYGCVPGMRKSALHKTYFRQSRFSRVLAGLVAHVRPALTVVDGVVGMEGDGPSSGRPAALGLVAAGRDVAALDAVLCRVIGLPAESVPVLRELRRRGLGETNWQAVNVVGEAVDAVRRPFAPPNTLGARLLPQWLADLAAPFFWCRPVFTDSCVSCGRCVDMCPAGALRLEAGARPVLDARACIECCCCHEVCPHQAVDMRLSPALRLLQRRDACLR
jgi:uncharacterized protein (DUF362 family)/Pyruvate/2-oxoacid:ferredoxin oxidoreductase delta subunit